MLNNGIELCTLQSLYGRLLADLPDYGLHLNAKKCELYPRFLNNRQPGQDTDTDGSDTEKKKIESPRRRQLQQQQRKTEQEPAPPRNQPFNHGCVTYH